MTGCLKIGKGTLINTPKSTIVAWDGEKIQYLASVNGNICVTNNDLFFEGVEPPVPFGIDEFQGVKVREFIFYKGEAAGPMMLVTPRKNVFAREMFMIPGFWIWPEGIQTILDGETLTPRQVRGFFEKEQIPLDLATPIMNPSQAMISSEMGSCLGQEEDPKCLYLLKDELKSQIGMVASKYDDLVPIKSFMPADLL